MKYCLAEKRHTVMFAVTDRAEKMKNYDFNVISYYSDRYSRWLEANPYGSN